jgi:amino acid transporter
MHGPWLLFALIGAALTIMLAYTSIGLSSVVILLFEAASILLVLMVGVVVLAKGGYAHQGISAAGFRPDGVGLSVLALGVVGVFGQFSGFEGAATLGEEARRATRTIPAAIVGSLILSAAVYIFATWVVYTAYPSAADVASDPAPLVHVAASYLNPGVGTAVNAAGVISAFGAQLACVNAASRLLYALGREMTGTAGRSALTRISRRSRAPIGALAVVATASVATVLSFAAERTAARAATLIVQYGSYLMLTVYLLTVVAALVVAARRRRGVVPLVVLGVGALLLGYILYRTFDPLPEPPFARIVLAAALSLLAGIAVALVPGLRRRLRRSPLLRVATGSASDQPAASELSLR